MKKRLYILPIILLTLGCYKETQPATDSVIVGLTASPSPAPADGASTVNIIAQIPGNTVPGSYNLTFFTTDGLFYDTQKSATTLTTQRPATNSGNRSATAILVCPADTGTATVMVSSADISRSIQVKFTFAFPQTVKLGVDKQFVSAGTATTEATLTLAMTRSTGICTPGLNVEASAVDTLGNPVGNFRNGNLVKSDKTGNATLYFSPNQTAYRGRVLLKAWLPDSNPVLADSLYVTITP